MFTEEQIKQRKSRWKNTHLPYALNAQIKPIKDISKGRTPNNYRWIESLWKLQWQTAFADICDFAQNSFSDKDILIDIGCGPRPCLDWFINGTKYHIDPLLESYQKILGLNKFWENKDKNNLIAAAGEEFVSELKNKCDFAVCWNVLDHTYNPYLIIKNIQIYLKTSGLALIATDLSKREKPGHPGWNSVTLFYEYINERFETIKTHKKSNPREFWERDITLFLKRK